MSKNWHTAAQLTLACRHVRELMASGVSENRAIRTLEHMVDRNAKLLVAGYASPQNALKIPWELWSVAATKAYEANPHIRLGDYLRVEHGTPRRGLARMVLELSDVDQLTDDSFSKLVNRYWKLAVITHEEDDRLTRLGRSKLYTSPDERWAAAGIVFGRQSNDRDLKE